MESLPYLRILSRVGLNSLISGQTKGCRFIFPALPPRRLTPCSLSRLSLEPVKRNLMFVSSIRRWTSSRSSGIFWISSMITSPSLIPLVSILSRRTPGSAYHLLLTLELRRDQESFTSSCSWLAIRELFPICRGPKRKRDLLLRLLWMPIIRFKYLSICHFYCRYIGISDICNSDFPEKSLTQFAKHRSW